MSTRTAMRTTDHRDLPRAMVFLAVVRAGSLSGAARDMGQAKSVLSDHLRQLEESLGARLFERDSRRFKLTELGARFLPYAQQIERAWSEGVGDVQSAMAEPSGVLRVTAPQLFEQAMISPVLAAYLARFPRVTAEVQYQDRLVDLVDQAFDVGIRTGQLTDSQMIATRVCSDRHVLVAPPALARALPPAARPSELRELPWISHAHFDVGAELVDPHGRPEALAIAPRARVDSTAALLGMVQRGVGATLLPALLVREELARGALVHLLPEWHGPPLDTYVVYPSRSFVPPKVARFIELLRAHLDATMARPDGRRAGPAGRAAAR